MLLVIMAIIMLLVIIIVLTKSRWWLKCLLAELPPRSYTLSHLLAKVLWSNGNLSITMGATYCKSAPFLIWSPWIFFTWRYNVFNLSFDFTWPRHWWPSHWGVMQIYRWSLLAVCYHLDNSCHRKNCDVDGEEDHGSGLSAT